MKEKIAHLKKSLEASVEKHRDAYNQALGGLYVLEQLEVTEPESMTEEELAKSLNAQSLSFEPIGVGGPIGSGGEGE